MGTKGERDAAREVLAAAKARTSRCRICLHGDIEDALEEASSAFDADPDDAALAAAVVEAEQAVEDAKTEFVFQVGRGRWRKLMADHPPTDAQKEAGAEFNVDTFPFAAMAEFLVSPKLTVDELVELDEESLDEVKFAELWGACAQAYFGSRRPPSRAARRLLNGSGSSSSASNSGLAEAS